MGAIGILNTSKLDSHSRLSLILSVLITCNTDWDSSSSSSRTTDGQSSLADKCRSPLQIREAAVELLDAG